MVNSDQQCCVCAGRSAKSVSIKLSPVQKQPSFTGAVLTREDIFKNTHLQNKTFANFPKFHPFTRSLQHQGQVTPSQIVVFSLGINTALKCFAPSPQPACFCSRIISTVTPPSTLSLSWKSSLGAISQLLKTHWGTFQRALWMKPLRQWKSLSSNCENLSENTNSFTRSASWNQTCYLDFYGAK